jgi:hypothetical protein
MIKSMGTQVRPLGHLITLLDNTARFLNLRGRDSGEFQPAIVFTMTQSGASWFHNWFCLPGQTLTKLTPKQMTVARNEFGTTNLPNQYTLRRATDLYLILRLLNGHTLTFQRETEECLNYLHYKTGNGNPLRGRDDFESFLGLGKWCIDPIPEPEFNLMSERQLADWKQWTDWAFKPVTTPSEDFNHTRGSAAIFFLNRLKALPPEPPLPEPMHRPDPDPVPDRLGDIPPTPPPDLLGRIPEAVPAPVAEITETRLPAFHNQPSAFEERFRKAGLKK